MDYIIASHGGRWATPEEKVTVPVGFTVKFFVADGLILPNTVAWPIHTHLLAGDTASIERFVTQTVFEGGTTYNYSCWHYPELGRNSSIFKVGQITTSNPLVDMSNHPAHKPLTLAELFKILPEPGVIYWTACRDIT